MNICPRIGLIFFVLVLAGCTASAKYDIDVECFTWNFVKSGYKDMTLRCYESATKGNLKFEIKCKEDTFQQIEEERLCTTHDGKSVRVKLFSANSR